MIRMVCTHTPISNNPAGPGLDSETRESRKARCLFCALSLCAPRPGCPVRLWKTHLSRSSEMPLKCQAVEKSAHKRAFSKARAPRSVLQRIRLGNGRDNLRCRALRRNLARMLPQFRKRHAANAISHQNSESQRRQRRTDQHQHIHCILHIPNIRLGFAEGPSPFGLDALMRRPPLFLPLSFVTELSHVDPLFCCRLRYESIQLPEF